MELPVAFKSSPDGTQHAELHNVTEHDVARCVHHTTYVHLSKDALL